MANAFFADDQDQSAIKEDLDALSAYRAIKDPGVRSIACKLLANIAEAEAAGDITPSLRDLAALSNALQNLKPAAKLPPQ